MYFSFILNIATQIPINTKANVIKIKGTIIEGSMLGFDSLLMVAGWCKYSTNPQKI